MYGQRHRFCQNCGHAVYSGYGQSCTGCGLGFAQMMMLDEAITGGLWSQGGPGLGFDWSDGQVVIEEPGGFGFEPGTGQVDIDTPFGDFPI